ncbi:MAG: 50S ribosomal protein L1 [Bdellovibrionales bacterium]|nr:50S ribosomal protein L1 [Bdellovibrionales bacterium]
MGAGKKSGKKYKEALKKVEKGKIYSVEEGIRLVLESAPAKFDEAVDVAVALGVDARQSDQQVRGAMSLPHGLGRKVRVLVFAKGEQEEEAKKAGADFIGAEDMVEKIKSGWLDFDRVIATPDMMPTLAKVAKILGPKGLMPSPKSGTVTAKVSSVVQAEKKGRASFRVDKNSIIHTSIGRKSMGLDKLKQNYMALAGELIKSKPSGSKGVYLKKISISSTMGPGVELNPAQTQNEAL